MFGITSGGVIFANQRLPNILVDEQNETVRATASDGVQTRTVDVIVSIQDLNQPAVFTAPSALRGVPENTLRGFAVSPAASATHPQWGIVYSLFAVPRHPLDLSPLFTIHNTTAVLTVAGPPAPFGSFLNYEVNASYTVTVSARDLAPRGAFTVLQDIVVTVLDVPEPPQVRAPGWLAGGGGGRRLPLPPLSPPSHTTPPPRPAPVSRTWHSLFALAFFPPCSPTPCPWPHLPPAAFVTVHSVPRGEPCGWRGAGPRLPSVRPGP